jgi:hypothetical protein
MNSVGIKTEIFGCSLRICVRGGFFLKIFLLKIIFLHGENI